MTERDSPRRNAHKDRRSFLLARAKILTEVRAWFAERGFIEADVSSLVAVPGGEAHLKAFETDLVRPDGSRERRYLATSPEFAMKRLIAAGETRLYDFARVFRNAEATPLHAPAFTLLEWYRAEEAYDAVMADALALLALAADATGIATMRWRDRTCDPRAEAERLTVADAFAAHASVDLAATLDAGGEGDRDALAARAEAAGVACAADDLWSDVFARILAERVEPRLGLGRPTILLEYPAPEAALARRHSRDPRFAERFELYVAGVELANGFGELTDPAEQRRRFEAEMALKESRYGERWPIDEELLAALSEMPETSGVALGFDRLVMLATGARRIDDVLWTPPE
jgi:lysyl-tRNA synthetase class 2